MDSSVFFRGAMGGLICYCLKKITAKKRPAFTAIPQESLKEVKWSIFIQSEWRKNGIVVDFWRFHSHYTFIFIFSPLIRFEQTASENFDTYKSLIAYGLFLVIAGLLADRVSIQTVMLSGIWLFSIVIIPSSIYVKIC